MTNDSHGKVLRVITSFNSAIPPFLPGSIPILQDVSVVEVPGCDFDDVEFGYLLEDGRVRICGINGNTPYWRVKDLYKRNGKSLDHTTFEETKKKLLPLEKSFVEGFARIVGGGTELEYDISTLGGLSGSGIYNTKNQLCGKFPT
jgi:hypothetical protein